MQTRSVVERIARKFGALRMRRVSTIWPQGVVSFTFDDFPKSALSAGGAILERHGVRGTYYTAFGLAGTQGAPGAMFDIEDARAAHARGHEIACHTYAHVNCAEADSARLRSEIDANAAAAMAEGFSLNNFSYPFGSVSPEARRVLGARFSCCRGIQPGINEGVPDYPELRANKIYSSLFDESRMRAIIDRNRAAGGWLIFYTHDVTESPSAYGCTAGELERVATYAVSRSPVLPVRDIVSALGIATRAP